MHMEPEWKANNPSRNAKFGVRQLCPHHQKLCETAKSLAHTVSDVTIPIKVRAILIKASVIRDGIKDDVILLACRLFDKYTHSHPDELLSCRCSWEAHDKL